MTITPPSADEVAAIANRYQFGLSSQDGVGMMIIGRHNADSVCLRVAHAYEMAVGGFPRHHTPGGPA